MSRARCSPACAALALAWAGAWAADTLPDPTRPPAIHADAVRRLSIEQPQQFTVSAIKIAGAVRKAIVNNRLVGVGERIGDALIAEINPGSVVIEYLSQRLRVNLLTTQVRRVAHNSGSEAR